MEEIIKKGESKTTIDIELELLKKIRNLLEVANSRMNWKIEELLPVGLVIKDLDDLINKNNV
tara:strand:+ start:110 stop:295 length:186 start_codon:yes stop_codon:yes gene_type:complete